MTALRHHAGDPTLSQINSVHPPPPLPVSSRYILYLQSGFLTEKIYAYLFYPMHATCLAYLIVLHFLLIISHFTGFNRSHHDVPAVTLLSTPSNTQLPSKLMWLFHVRTLNGTMPGDLQRKPKRTFRYVYGKVTNEATKTWYVINGCENSESQLKVNATKLFAHVSHLMQVHW
jgi:hypothetical protein